jgi:hypothetical protein
MKLEQKRRFGPVDQLISEIDAVAAQVQENDDPEMDLKSQLELYYDTIRQLQNVYRKQIS